MNPALTLIRQPLLSIQPTPRPVVVVYGANAHNAALLRMAAAWRGIGDVVVVAEGEGEDAVWIKPRRGGVKGASQALVAARQQVLAAANQGRWVIAWDVSEGGERGVHALLATLRGCDAVGEAAAVVFRAGVVAFQARSLLGALATLHDPSLASGVSLEALTDYLERSGWSVERPADSDADGLAHAA